MKFAGVMFDLDGTLADTLADIAAAGNHAMGHVGRPTYPVAQYRFLAGQGLQRLIRDALGPEHAELFDAAHEAFKAYYAQHRYDQTRPFDGIAKLLDELTRRGLKLSVMSNKPDEATVDMVRQVFGAWSFDEVRGHRDGYPVKPDPKAPLEIAATLGIAPDRWVYVGDTDVDMQTGIASGFFTVGVTWGFRSVEELNAAGAQAIIEHPLQLLNLLD